MKMSAAVYPRAGGATARDRLVRRTGGGLSPRWRGNPHRLAVGLASTRSIPALAGQPLWNSERYSSAAVYPRAGGATVLGLDPDCHLDGLSPRWRGNLVQTVATDIIERSIPALVGQPGPLEPGAGAPEVYPRAGGATVSWVTEASLVRGLSPRWRGNHRPAGDGRCRHRSIPALAGQPSCAGHS